MRRLVLSFLLFLVLVVPAAAFALERTADDGALSVKHARGVVSLRFKGAIIGRLGHGEITAIDPIADDGSGPVLWGCEHKTDLSDNTQNPNDVIILCAGTDIRFRMIGGKYTVTLKGTGIFLSAVGRGFVGLDGRGGEPGITRDGVFSINDAPYVSLPDDAEDFLVAAPAGN